MSKRVIVFAAIAAAAACVFLPGKRSLAEKERTYDYKLLPLSEAPDLEKALDSLGAQGWKLVEIDDLTSNIVLVRTLE